MHGRLTGSIVMATASAMIAAASSGQCNPEEVATLLASDGNDFDFFGSSVALSGDIAVIGAPFADNPSSNGGVAYVFLEKSPRQWIEIDKLTPGDRDTFDRFGSAVGVSGETAIIGSPADDDRGSASGSAYVYRDNGARDWTFRMKLLASDGRGGDEFGRAGAISGDTAVIGAWLNSERASEAGAAYVFIEDQPGHWQEIAKLTASDAEPVDHFGISVAIDGDVIIVGAPSDNGRGDPGAAYVFERGPSGEWSEAAILTASDGEADDFFGDAVAVSGARAIVGARFDDGIGSAYIYERTSQGDWSQTAKLRPGDAGSGDEFGDSVAISGRAAVIGGPGADDAGDGGGVAVAFVKTNAGEWVETGRIVPDKLTNDARFGEALALNGNNMIGGAGGSGLNGFAAGAAWVYDLNCPGGEPTLEALGACPGLVTLRVAGATPGQRVAFLYALGAGGVAVPPGRPCAGTVLGLDRTARLADVIFADIDGIAQIEAMVPGQACGVVIVQAIDLGSCTPTNVVSL